MFRYVWNGLCRSLRARPQIAAQTSKPDDNDGEIFDDEHYLNFNYKQHDITCYGEQNDKNQPSNLFTLQIPLSINSVWQTRHFQTSAVQHSLLTECISLSQYAEISYTVTKDHPAPGRNHIKCALPAAQPQPISSSDEVLNRNQKTVRFCVESSDDCGSIDHRSKEANGKKGAPNSNLHDSHVNTGDTHVTTTKLKRVDTFEVLLSSVKAQEFSLSAQQCVGQSFNVHGNQQAKENKDEEAFASFMLGTSNGCSKAQFNVGICYQFGRGTAKNMEKAKHFYNLASRQGHAQAQYNLAMIILSGKSTISVFDKARAVNLLELSAAQGFAKSQCLLGVLMMEKGAHYNPEKSVELFTMSSKLNPLSKYHLGQCYEHGLGGLTAEPLQAYHLYAEAANDGNLDAQYKMACMLADGCHSVVKKNKTLAVDILQKAASNGHKMAAIKLKEINKDTNIAKSNTLER